MSRELQGIIAEFSNAAAEGIRQCLAVAEDLQVETPLLSQKASRPSSQEEGGASEFKEMVREQLLAMVRLEREAGHIKTSLEHVQTVAAGVQTTDPPEVGGIWGSLHTLSLQEPPVLLDEMEDKLKALMEEPFDPCSHASVQELTRLLASDGGVGDVHETEEEVQVERVSSPRASGVPGSVCVSDPAVPEVSTDWWLFGGPSQEPRVWPHLFSRCSAGAHPPQVSRYIWSQAQGELPCSRASRGARCPVCSGPLSGVSLQPQPRLAKKARRARRKEGLP